MGKFRAFLIIIGIAPYFNAFRNYRHLAQELKAIALRPTSIYFSRGVVVLNNYETFNIHNFIGNYLKEMK